MAKRPRRDKNRSRRSRGAKEPYESTAANPHHMHTSHPPRAATLVGKTEGQKRALTALSAHDQVVITGPAGTGKTYMVAGHAALLFMDKKIDKIVLTRPNVPAGPELGHLPGDMGEKMAPWAAPVRDVLEKFMGRGPVEYAVKSKQIEIIPLETMRGRSFDNAYIIADEAQNMTFEQLKMLVTRTGTGSKLVIDGDINQSDIGYDSGLYYLLDVILRQRVPVSHVSLTADDIVRSGLVKAWVKAFNAYDRDLGQPKYWDRRVVGSA